MASKTDGNKKPVAEWGLDPIHWTHVKLFINDILSLPENQTIKGTFNLYDHVIIRVCIMGYVVSVDEKEAMFQYVVDDGTGVITCCKWKKKSEDEEFYSGIRLGMLVKVDVNYSGSSLLRSNMKVSFSELRPTDRNLKSCWVIIANVRRRNAVSSYLAAIKIENIDK
eukprot:Seg1430.16 transcript_id=Seg1430.16/GoldUCD/mRNA.D3Y31 product="CST complex subunit STN1" protein_id=Seg1430.16/GoldUCD/D3Y31